MNFLLRKYHGVPLHHLIMNTIVHQLNLTISHVGMPNIIAYRKQTILDTPVKIIKISF